MVGAGGIGCELLKDLVLTGFGTIHIVDLDTIDLSNLNRQFLFRHEHIKKSKALVSGRDALSIVSADGSSLQVAKESAAKFNPHVTLKAHHANIKDPQFNIDWFGSFDVVFNALDNLEARRHVNKLCLAANVPLIESGTTGFNGQVQIIKKVRCAQRGLLLDFAESTREKRNAMIVMRSRCLRAFPSAPSAARQASPYIVSYGQRAIFSSQYHVYRQLRFTNDCSELFGTSEDEATELDHSEDTENGNSPFVRD